MHAGGGADLVEGGQGNDSIYGGDGDDWLFGESFSASSRGSDVLDGGNGNDYLMGGNDRDVLWGGAGNDILIGDYMAAYPGDSDTAPPPGGYFPGDDELRGGAGADALYGNEGNDSLVGGDGDDRLIGDAGSDYLSGDAGNDYLDGGRGINTLLGGAGDDTYVIHSTSENSQEAANEGVDRIIAEVGIALPDHFENLTLAPTAGASHGTGNALANRIEGNDFANTLEGGAGDDQLFGFGGDDRLSGGAGNDTVAGGTGDDFYLVDSIDDEIIEAPGEGVDSVLASGDYEFPANVENLSLAPGSAVGAFGNAQDGTGNDLANLIIVGGRQNVLSGGAGNDTLIGNGGGDVLLGGSGNDTLQFAADDLGVAGTRWDGGSGADTLAFSDQAGQVLDLTAIDDERAIGIEIVDLTGTGDNMLALAASDLVALSDTDALRVDGNVGDVLTVVDPGWSRGADLSFGDTLYHTYLNQGAMLLVDADVMTAFV